MNYFLRASMLTSLLASFSGYADTGHNNILRQKGEISEGNFRASPYSSPRGGSHGPSNSRGGHMDGGGPDTLSYQSQEEIDNIMALRNSNPGVEKFLYCQTYGNTEQNKNKQADTVAFIKSNYYGVNEVGPGYIVKEVNLNPNALYFYLVNSDPNTGIPVGWVDKVDLPNTPYTQKLIKYFNDNSENPEYKNCFYKNVKEERIHRSGYDKMKKYRGLMNNASYPFDRKIIDEEGVFEFDKLSGIYGLDPAHFLPKNSDSWGKIYITIEQRDDKNVTKLFSPNTDVDDLNKSFKLFKNTPTSKQFIAIRMASPDMVMDYSGVGAISAKLKNQFPAGVYKLIINGVENTKRLIVQSKRVWIADDALLGNDCSKLLNTDDTLDSGKYAATTFYYGNEQPSRTGTPIIKENLFFSIDRMQLDLKERTGNSRIDEQNGGQIAFTTLALGANGASTGSDRCEDTDYTRTEFTTPPKSFFDLW